MTKFLYFFKGLPAATNDVATDAKMDRARALQQQGQLRAAIAMYDEVLAVQPASAEGHYRRANALKDDGALEAALAGYNQAIALEPNDARALCNRAVVQGQLQRWPEALADYDRAIALDPSDPLVHCNRGMLLNALGRKDAALTAFDAAIACDAAFPLAHFGRAAVLQERQQWAHSLASYDRAIELSPGDIAAQLNRATVLRHLERWSDALAGYDRSLALNPNVAQAHAGRAECLQCLDRLQEALDSYDQAIELEPSNAAMYNGRGVVLQKMARSDAALASYNRSLAIDPNQPQACFNRGTLLAELQTHEGALSDYRRAIALKPDFAEAHLNLALTSLRTGDFVSGWTHYEWRWRAERGPILVKERAFVEPLWLGTGDIDGRTVLLYAEQGLGDSLMFCRYAERIAALGARVILEVPRPLFDVCSTLDGVTRVVAHGDPLPRFDVRCPLMSLPFALKTTLQTIPAEIPYLKSNPEKVLAWTGRLGAKLRPRIGLTWSGSRGSRTYSPRSYPLASLIPLLPQGFDYYCMQTEIADADAKTLNENPAIHRFDSELRDFSETAALCECLDLVITMDTSVAHLAGALGKRTWVLIPYDGDWKWLLDREDSPWYPTVRLFRQRSRNDWQEVFARVVEALQAHFGGQTTRGT
jgi:tetratricopeptide (TPR) repeat protein